LTLEFTRIFDFLEFLEDEGIAAVSLSMDEGQNAVAFFPSVFASEPSVNVSVY
jgi:hypothetical protein